MRGMMHEHVCMCKYVCMHVCALMNGGPGLMLNVFLYCSPPYYMFNQGVSLNSEFAILTSLVSQLSLVF